MRAAPTPLQGSLWPALPIAWDSAAPPDGPPKAGAPGAPPLLLEATSCPSTTWTASSNERQKALPLLSPHPIRRAEAMVSRPRARTWSGGSGATRHLLAWCPWSGPWNAGCPLLSCPRTYSPSPRLTDAPRRNIQLSVITPKMTHHLLPHFPLKCHWILNLEGAMGWTVSLQKDTLKFQPQNPGGTYLEPGPLWV